MIPHAPLARGTGPGCSLAFALPGVTAEVARANLLLHVPFVGPAMGASLRIPRGGPLVTTSLALHDLHIVAVPQCRMTIRTKTGFRELVASGFDAASHPHVRAYPALVLGPFERRHGPIGSIRSCSVRHVPITNYTLDIDSCRYSNRLKSN